MKNQERNSYKRESAIRFINMLAKAPSGAEEDHYEFHEDRENILKIGIASRVGGLRRNKFSAQFVIQQAAERYFCLMDEAIFSMRSMFTENEMIVILDANCSPIFSWGYDDTVASMIDEDVELENIDDLSHDPALQCLMKKLLNLSSIQNAALIDVCERFWRGPSAGTITAIFQKMRLFLV